MSAESAAGGGARDRDLLALPAVLDIAAAHGLKEALLDAGSSSASLIIDGANVERVGTPALQVLLAAARELGGGERRFALTNPSPALRAAFADLGLAAELQRWSTG
jgi:anti-anti-sigma regulatory factor